MTSLHFLPSPDPAQEFLSAQLDYAQTQIERLTRHLTSMRENLIAAGQTELAADALLAESSKPWRQFRKDYAFFHSLFARLQRMLKPMRTAAHPDAVPPDAKPEPIRVTRIGRNERCPCGSGKKYKFCCLGLPSSANLSASHAAPVPNPAP